MIYEYGTIFEGKSEKLESITQNSSLSCLVHGDLFSKNVHFDSISASFAFLKGIALNIFEDKKLNINIKLLEEKHHYCETYFAILDGRKQKIGGIGVIGETLLNKLDIAHKHDVVVLDIDPTIFIDYRNFKIKVNDVVPYPAVARDLNFKMDSSISCLLYTSPSPRDRIRSRMPSSA